MILDGDDGLLREVRHKLDLLVGERVHLLAKMMIASELRNLGEFLQH